MERPNSLVAKSHQGRTGLTAEALPPPPLPPPPFPPTPAEKEEGSFPADSSSNCRVQCQQAPIKGSYVIYEIILLHKLPRLLGLFQDSNSSVKSKRLEQDL